VDDLYTLLGRLESDNVAVDLGCGRGSFHYEVCRGRIIALDLTLPEKRTPCPQVTYVRADSSAIPLPNASADAVISHHTLEHFLDYKTTLSDIRVVQAATLQMHPLRRTERFRSAAAGFSVDSLSSIPVLRLRE